METIKNAILENPKLIVAIFAISGLVFGLVKLAGLVQHLQHA
jgi:hypothetical protein